MAQSDFDRLHASTRSEIRSLIDKLTSGKLDVDGFGDEVYGVLQEAHAEAHYQGRKRAGSKEPRNEEDDLVGRGKADNEFSEFFEGLLEDIEGGRYGEPGEMRDQAIKSRSEMYCHKLRGTANESFVENSPDTSVFMWRLGATEHCEDCLNMESQNPWTKNTLFRYPGSGDTICKVHCACRLERKDGVVGIERVETFIGA